MAKQKNNKKAIKPANEATEAQIAEGFEEATDESIKGGNQDTQQSEDSTVDTRGETATTGEQGTDTEESVVVTKTVKQLEKLLGCSLKSVVTSRLYVTADKMGFASIEDARTHACKLNSDKIEVYDIK